MNIIGRKNETKALSELYRHPQASLVALYGRRRVGKSYLLEHWAKNKPTLFFEGLEKVDKKKQILNLQNIIKSRLQLQSLANLKDHSWTAIFDLLSLCIEENSQKEKLVLIFDEFQWLCSGRSEVVSLFKMYWDQKWKNQNVMIILCGSIASFMVNKVIRSKALYGRINLELHIKPFQIKDCHEMLKPIRSTRELLQYYYVFGGIPRYLKEIYTKQSFEQNVNRLCFKMDSPLSDEFEKIFYQQFKSARIYIDIIKLLSKGAKTFQEVSTSLNIASGGSLKKYLDNLFLADFIGSYYPFHRGDRSKDKKYFLSDEFCHFYLQYIEKNHSAIRNNTQQDLFSKITKKNWSQYLALNFERFCFKEANTIAQYCGFRDEVKEIGKFYPDAKVNIQLDLVYSRFDEVITIFEIKSGEQIGVQIINEFEKKMETLKRHPAFYKRKIEKGIIYLGKIDPAIAKLKYFHYLVDIDDLGF